MPRGNRETKSTAIAIADKGRASDAEGVEEADYMVDPQVQVKIFDALPAVRISEAYHVRGINMEITPFQFAKAVTPGPDPWIRTNGDPEPASK